MAGSGQAGDAGRVHRVFVLWHFKVAADEAFVLDGNDKCIGVYSSHEAAEAAIARLGGLPGFRDWPEGFRIFVHEVNKVFGAEGFPRGYDASDWARSLRGG